MTTIYRDVHIFDFTWASKGLIDKYGGPLAILIIETQIGVIFEKYCSFQRIVSNYLLLFSLVPG